MTRDEIRKDIDAICCIYKTVGDAMFDEVRVRLVERIAARLAADEVRVSECNHIWNYAGPLGQEPYCNKCKIRKSEAVKGLDELADLREKLDRIRKAVEPYIVEGFILGPTGDCLLSIWDEVKGGLRADRS